MCTSNLLRPHILVIILTLLVTEQLFVLVSNPQSIWQRIKYSLMAAGIIYCHMLAINVLIAHALYVGLSTLTGQLTIKQFSAWFISSVVAAILFLPFVFSIFGVMHNSENLWHLQSDFLTFGLFVADSLINQMNISLQMNKVLFAVIICACSILCQPKPNQLPDSASYACYVNFIGSV